MKNLILILLASFTMMFTACKKNEISQPVTPAPQAQNILTGNYIKVDTLDGGYGDTLKIVYDSTATVLYIDTTFYFTDTNGDLLDSSAYTTLTNNFSGTKIYHFVSPRFSNLFQSSTDIPLAGSGTQIIPCWYTQQNIALKGYIGMWNVLYISVKFYNDPTWHQYQYLKV